MLLPVLLGVVAGIGRQKQWDRWAIEKIGLKTFEQHDIPTAWDHVFSQAEPSWVILTFKDGNKVYGWFGENSYVSSDPDERDIYISETVAPGENGALEFVTNTKGVYVRIEDLRSVEFIRDETNHDTT